MSRRHQWIYGKDKKGDDLFTLHIVKPGERGTFVQVFCGHPPSTFGGSMRVAPATERQCQPCLRAAERWHAAQNYTPLRKLTEREQVETVFALGGGALEKTPWEYAPGKVFTYWYEGTPDYVGYKDYPAIKGVSYEYATVCSDELWGPRDTPEGWERVARYGSSGEAEHPDIGCDEVNPDPDDPERWQYLGDGWGETVYRRPYPTDPADEAEEEVDPDADTEEVER